MQPPPRSHDRLAPSPQTSMISVPVEARLDDLARGLDAALPRTLWTIDKKLDRCIPPQKVHILGARIKVLGGIPCSVSGQADRGAITLRGNGQDLIATIPITARITARDAKARLKGETATGSADAEARIEITIAPDWTPGGTVKIHYDWTTPPGIDLLGQRITFTEKADEKLKPVIHDLEQKLPTELAKLQLRDKAARSWRSGFTSVLLNRDNPPVWMRLTPKQIYYSGYRIANGRIRLDAGIRTLTETFVGQRPADPVPMPLPNIAQGRTNGRFNLFVPVTADYSQLEPVILRALVKRSQRPLDLPGIGPVIARFDHVTAYGTTGRKMAVGIDLAAWPAGSPEKVSHGRLWLVAIPVNQPGSAVISFSDLSVHGSTDSVRSDLLVALGNSPGISDLLASAIGQNLTSDLQKLLVKIRRAIADKRMGDFTVHARIDRVQTGVIETLGDGVHLPVRAGGEAEVSY